MTKHILYLTAAALAVSAVAVSQTAAPVQTPVSGTTTNPAPVRAPPPIPSGPAGASGATGASGKNKNGLGLEVEHVRINDFVAIPSVITRPAGPFYLYITNGTVTTQASLTLDSTTAAAQQISSISGTLNLPFIGNAKHVVGLFSAPPGQYLLRSQPSGKILLTINIQ